MAEAEKLRILCVDDEPLVLQGLRQRLRRGYDIHLAEGAEEGLKALADEGPFAVVISDMRMPGMNGAEFLEQVCKREPDAVRMLLTGYSDAEAAADAVNRGRIFRFLTKPCPANVLEPAIEEATQRYLIMRAEKDVLEQTVRGVVGVMTETLALASPAAFTRANRVSRIMKRFAASFPEMDAWELEVAAMLSQIGVVTLPPEVVELWLSGGNLTVRHSQLIKAYPGLSADLVGHIPRLGNVSKMIRLLGVQSDRAEQPEYVSLGARILKAVLDYDALIFAGKSPDEAIAAMRERGAEYDQGVLKKLAGASVGLRSKLIVRQVTAKDLAPGMVLHESVKTKHGTTVAPDGVEVTTAMVARLRNFSSFGNLQEPLVVLAPE